MLNLLTTAIINKYEFMPYWIIGVLELQKGFLFFFGIKISPMSRLTQRQESSARCPASWICALLTCFMPQC